MPFFSTTKWGRFGKKWGCLGKRWGRFVKKWGRFYLLPFIALSKSTYNLFEGKEKLTAINTMKSVNCEVLQTYFYKIYH